MAAGRYQDILLAEALVARSSVLLELELHSEIVTQEEQRPGMVESSILRRHCTRHSYGMLR